MEQWKQFELRKMFINQKYKKYVGARFNKYLMKKKTTKKVKKENKFGAFSIWCARAYMEWIGNDFLKYKPDLCRWSLTQMLHIHITIYLFLYLQYLFKIILSKIIGK